MAGFWYTRVTYRPMAVRLLVREPTRKANRKAGSCGWPARPNKQQNRSGSLKIVYDTLIATTVRGFLKLMRTWIDFSRRKNSKVSCTSWSQKLTGTWSIKKYFCAHRWKTSRRPPSCRCDSYAKVLCVISGLSKLFPTTCYSISEKSSKTKDVVFSRVLRDNKRSRIAYIELEIKSSSW